MVHIVHFGAFWCILVHNVAVLSNMVHFGAYGAYGALRYIMVHTVHMIYHEDISSKATKALLAHCWACFFYSSSYFALFFLLESEAHFSIG